MIRSNWLSCANPSNWGWGVNYYSMYRMMYCIDFIPLCPVSGCQPRSLQELGVSSILKMCCPGCSSASCSPLSAPSMDQRGGREWLCCSSLHRANATYALAQSLRFFCLGEEPSDNDTLHTVKGKCHGIFLSSAHCNTLWGFLKTQTGFSLILYTTAWSNYSWLFDFQARKLHTVISPCKDCC